MYPTTPDPRDADREFARDVARDPDNVPPSLVKALERCDRHLRKFEQDGQEVRIEVIPRPTKWRRRRHAVVLTAIYGGVRRVVAHRRNYDQAAALAHDVGEWRGLRFGTGEGGHNFYDIVDD